MGIVPRKSFFEMCCASSKTKRSTDILNNIKQMLDANAISKKKTEEKWKILLNYFRKNFLKRWEKSSRKRDLFTKKKSNLA